MRPAESRFASKPASFLGNQSVSGTDKGNAIINFHLATGRINRMGAGPFSVTGQPNAMGGREVGGLANTLACHLGFFARERALVQDFWQASDLAEAPGLKAVDLFRAVREGRIKFLWIMATNPAVSMPDAGFVREALEKCPNVVVSDIMANTDTGKFADVKLPADTPVALVENASLDDGRHFMTRLDLLPLAAPTALGDGPALILIGQALGAASPDEKQAAVAAISELGEQ